MRAARYIITICADDTPATITRPDETGAPVTLIVARTFEEAATLYHQAEARRAEA